MKTETVQEVIDILMRVEDKTLPLIFRTKHITMDQSDNIAEGGTIDSGSPNSTVQIYDIPKQAVLELIILEEEN